MTRRKRIARASVLAVLAGCASAGSAGDGPKRVALVVGNSAYQHATQLRNPSNDASAMSSALERLGWQVTVGRDLTRAGLQSLVQEFSPLVAGADAAVFFYAGHAVQLEGTNYLVPVDGNFESADQDVTSQLLSLNSVLDKIGQARTSVVFLDACRNNPWSGDPEDTAASGRSVTVDGGRGLSVVGRGLAKVSSKVGTLIAFATSPGMVAADGDGNHSPFTAGLLKHIEEPGLEVTEILRRVRASVQAETGGAQLPWDTSALVESLYFRTRAVSRPPPP